jgi:hypothetical protein
VAILGLHRLGSIEEAVRTAPAGVPVTVLLVTSSPEELAALARLALAEVTGCLRAAFPATALPRLRVLHDDTGSLAAAAGLPAVSDTTQAAVLIRDGRIVARAEGFGACYAAAAIA